MNKLTFSQLCNEFSKHNAENNVKQQFTDDNRLTGYVVFKSSNWPEQDYSLESRTYRFASDNKYFIPEMIGNSIFANNLDGTDKCIRLEQYIGHWKIDYCYIENHN